MKKQHVDGNVVQGWDRRENGEVTGKESRETSKFQHVHICMLAIGHDTPEARGSCRGEIALLNTNAFL